MISYDIISNSNERLLSKYIFKTDLATPFNRLFIDYRDACRLPVHSPLFEMSVQMVAWLMAIPSSANAIVIVLP